MLTFIKCFPCARNFFRCLININWFLNFHNYLNDIGNDAVSLNFQMKVNHRGFEESAQGHTNGMQQSQDLNSYSLSLKQWKTKLIKTHTETKQKQMKATKKPKILK